MEPTQGIASYVKFRIKLPAFKTLHLPIGYQLTLRTVYRNVRKYYLRY